MYGYNHQQQPAWPQQPQPPYSQPPPQGGSQMHHYQAQATPGQPPYQDSYGKPQYPQQPAAFGAPQPWYGGPAPPVQAGHGLPQGSSLDYAADPNMHNPAPYAQPAYAVTAPYTQQAPAPPSAPPVYLGALLAVDPLQPYATVPLSLPGYDPSTDVEGIKKATKGFGTNENALHKILCLRTAGQMQVLAQAYTSRYGKDLIELLKEETSGNHEKTLCLLAMGPLASDVQLLHDAIAGAGTKESIVTEILVGRHPTEMILLRHAFGQRYNKALDKEVLDDLSLKTKDGFAIVLQGRWLDNGQVQPQLIEKDLRELLPAFRLGFTNEMLICSIIFARSPTYLQALVTAFKQRNGKSLTNQIKQHFRGHLQDALLFAVEGGKRDGMGIWRDAKRFEAAMAGAGTSDDLLIARTVRAHWDRNRLEQIKLAYQQKYKKPLVKRVQGETSRHYRDALLTILNGW